MREHKAVASLLLGLASVLCLGPIAGLPAIAFGAMARRDIQRSRGVRTGSGLAAGGIVLGLFGTGIGLVGMLVVASGLVEIAQAPAASDRVLTSATPTCAEVARAAGSPRAQKAAQTRCR